MSILRIGSSGKIGVLTGIPPHTLPAEAWSEGQNVRCLNGSLHKFLGQRVVFGTPSIAPYWLLPAPLAANYYWLYAGLLKVYATDATAHYNVTRQVASAGAPTAALAGLGAGNLSAGAYTYKITFVNANGETQGGTTSNTVTVAAPATDGQINLTSIPLGGTTVTSRKVYRTIAGGAQHKLVTTIANNTATTYTDNIADASLGANVPTTNSADWDYAANADQNWTGGNLGGLPIINNGVDPPQMWNPVSTSTRLAQLSNWPASTFCSALRVFKQFVVALDVTKSSVRYPTMVKWSHPADPGTVPSSWDPADATKDAGEYPLDETPGFCIDCLPLRDLNVIYKEDSAWGMQYIGGQSVFRFFGLPGVNGILSRRCVQSFFGRHLVFGRGDIYLFDGQNVESILAPKQRNQLFNTSIDATYYQRAFLALNPEQREAWFCYPEVGSTLPNRALVWNWQENTFGVRDLPSVAHMEAGVVDPGVAQNWDAQIGTWDANTQPWDLRQYNPVRWKALLASPTNTKIYQVDQTHQFDGGNMTAYAQRTGLTLGTPASLLQRNLVSELWPVMRATGPVNFYIGTQAVVDGVITWSAALPFNPMTDRKIDYLSDGLYHSVKVESTGDVSWELDELGFNVEPVSLY